MRILFLVWNRDGAGTVGFGRMVLLVLLSFVLVFGGSSPLLAEAGEVDDVLTSASIGVTKVDDVGVSAGGIETPSVAAPSSVEEVSRDAVVASIAVAGGLLPLDVVALEHVITIYGTVNYVGGNSSADDGSKSDLPPAENRLIIATTGKVNRDAYGAQGSSSDTVRSNTVDLYGEVKYHVFGGQIYNSGSGGSVINNTINVFPGGVINGAAYGGYHEYAGGVANFNTINIKSGARVAQMSYGGTAFSSADNNTVSVNGTTGSIAGGHCFGGNGHANNNKVTIGDGAMVQNLVYGGVGDSVANNNTVEITGGTMTLGIFGGYSEGTQANNNTVIVRGNPTIKETVAGGWTPTGTGSGNTLEKNSDVYMPELRHFQTIRFGYSGNSGIGDIQTISKSPELIFDTSSYNITHSTRIVQHDSRFVKKGTGTLTLVPGATLAGMDIIVAEGTLRLAAGISLSLPFSPTRGHIVVMPGATLVVDEGVNINIAGAGKVTVGGRLENRGTLTNNAGSGGIVVESTGTLANNGRITVNDLGVLTMNGAYVGSNRVYFNCRNTYNNNLNGSNAKTVLMTVSITKTSIRNRDVLAQKYIYDGKAKEPFLRIATSTLLRLNDPIFGIDYTFTYENNINAGKAKVVISGVEPSWYNSYSEEFTISPADITTTAIASNPDCAYTGKPVAMKSVLTYMGMTLVNGRDYTVSYANNTNLGVATATITGIGNYTGTRTLNFSIVPKEAISQSPDKDGNGTDSGTTTGSFKDKAGKTAALVISGLKNRAWTGKQIKPVVTVKAGSKSLKAGTDYTVSYGKNKDIGKGSLIIKGKGNYSGTNALTFRIVPKKPTGLKLTAGKTALKVSWKKLSKAQNATGYQVQYRAVGSKKWTSRSVSAKATSLTLKKLKKGRQYQLRLRAYKTVAKVKYFSEWSKSKTGRLK